MSVSEVTSPALFALVWSAVAMAGLILYAVASTAYDLVVRRRRGPDRWMVPPRPARPRAYPGCIPCEAAETIGGRALIVHQERDHTGGVTW